ncbi:hypothetical protein WJX82_011382 [Trebouxia sp. C0006]
MRPIKKTSNRTEGKADSKAVNGRSDFRLHSQQMFLQLPEIYETFESRSAECAAQSCTSTAQWHWPSGDRVFTDLDQFRTFIRQE